MITRMHALVEMVCAAQGSTFRNHYKLKLYKGVLLMLRQKGIQRRSPMSTGCSKRSPFTKDTTSVTSHVQRRTLSTRSCFGP